MTNDVVLEFDAEADGREAVESLLKLRDALDNGDENTINELEATSGAVKSNTLIVIDSVIDALHSSRKINIRSIYYSNVAAFKRQSAVEDILRRISRVLQIRREQLNVRPSHKGLFLSSAISIQLRNGDLIQGSDTAAHHIPTFDDINQVTIVPTKSDVSFVLVVEKETVFSTLREMQFTASSIHGHSIMLTGKGYPDYATRDLLSHLAELLPSSVPIIAFVDSDPHGLRIFSTYKYGSERDAEQQRRSRCSRLMLLGLRCEEFDHLSIPPDQALQLTERDTAVCSNLSQHLDIKRCLSADPLVLSSSELSSYIFRQEIQLMTRLNRKWEIEALYNAFSREDEVRSNGECLKRYIDNKLILFFERQAAFCYDDDQSSVPSASILESSTLQAKQAELTELAELAELTDTESEDFLIRSDSDEEECIIE
ncbi:hypothetical protein E3P99_01785 [Wallemia hederae]|uniref:DNA topoisomerase (ATP-hydrolyzing) n=1 Tax=Wallemia hederae TaxID=1540922 RepID=A0A4T0FNH5_9BASI|nr:hypothetical protein E3P99_01785 [Wallemia hederae]